MNVKIARAELPFLRQDERSVLLKTGNSESGHYPKLQNLGVKRKFHSLNLAQSNIPKNHRFYSSDVNHYGNLSESRCGDARRKGIEEEFEEYFRGIEERYG